MGKAIGYFRVPATGTGTPAPTPAEAAIRTWCGNHGHQVVALMSDADRASDGLTMALEAAVKASMLVVDSLDSLSQGGIAPAQVLEKLLTAGAQLVSLHERLDSSAMGPDAARQAVGGSKPSTAAGDVRITFTPADPVSAASRPSAAGGYDLPEVTAEPVADEYAVPSITLEDVDPNEAATLAPPPMYGAEEDAGVVPGEDGETVSTWSLDEGDADAPADEPIGPVVTADQDDIDAMVMARQDSVASAAAAGTAPAGQSDIDFLFSMQAARKPKEAAQTPQEPSTPEPQTPSASSSDDGMAGMLELGGPGSEPAGEITLDPVPPVQSGSSGESGGESGEGITLDGMPDTDADELDTPQIFADTGEAQSPAEGQTSVDFMLAMKAAKPAGSSASSTGTSGDDLADVGTNSDMDFGTDADASDTPRIFADTGEAQSPAEGQTSVDFMLAMKATKSAKSASSNPESPGGDDFGLDDDMFGSDADLEEVTPQGFTDSGESVTPAENQADVDFLLATKKLRQPGPPVPGTMPPPAAQSMDALPGLSGNDTPDIAVPQPPAQQASASQAGRTPDSMTAKDREGIERYLAEMPPEDGLGYKVPPRGSSRASKSAAEEVSAAAPDGDDDPGAANPFEDLAREMAGEAAREMAQELTRGIVPRSGVAPSGEGQDGARLTPLAQGGSRQVHGEIEDTPKTFTPVAQTGKAVREDPHGIKVPPPPAGVPLKTMDRRSSPLEQLLLREAPKSYSPLANVPGMTQEGDTPPDSPEAGVTGVGGDAPSTRSANSTAGTDDSSDGGDGLLSLKPLQTGASHMVHGEIDLEVKSFTPMAPLAKAVRGDDPPTRPTQEAAPEPQEPLQEKVAQAAEETVSPPPPYQGIPQGARMGGGEMDSHLVDVSSIIARARAEVQADMGIKSHPVSSPPLSPAHAAADWVAPTATPVGGPGWTPTETADWDRRSRARGTRSAQMSEDSGGAMMRRHSDYTPVADAAARHVAQGHFKKAIATWEGFLSGADGHNLGMAMNAIGDIHVRQGNVTEAADQFQKAVEAFEKAGYYTKAVATLKKIHKITPQNKKIHLRTGELAARCGRLGDAVEAYLRYARCMVDRGDIFAAQNIFNRIRILDPLNARHRLQLAAELRDFGFLDESVAEILNATDILMAEGRHDEAQRHLLRMIDVMPTHLALQTALERVAKGDAAPVPEAPVEGGMACADLDLETDDGSMWHRPIDSDGKIV
ncbi:MAG: tetratricopeptide repeat protein [Nitrospirota bacterium]|nr:tetratricopeptide repeat protein [Nitrospirota bacterium]